MILVLPLAEALMTLTHHDVCVVDLLQSMMIFVGVYLEDRNTQLFQIWGKYTLRCFTL